jgi:hypothetical protein
MLLQKPLERFSMGCVKFYRKEIHKKLLIAKTSGFTGVSHLLTTIDICEGWVLDWGEKFLKIC